MKAAAPARRSRADAAAGLRDIAPVLLVAAPIGLLFGALCRDKGLSALEAGAMSLLVNAGAAQFAVLQLWSHPLPAAAILLSTALLHLRLALMGLSLAPRLAGWPARHRRLALALLADPVWALAERRGRSVSLAYWLGAALPFTAVWVAGTVLGVLWGGLAGDPRAIGLDFALPALLIAWLGAQRRGGAHDPALLAAAAASLAADLCAGAPWHIPAGAAAGIGWAWFSAGRRAAGGPGNVR